MTYKKLLKWGIVVFGIGIMVFLYKFYNPIDSIFFPKCLFKEFTGYKCPGCGSQRAIHYLLNLEIGQAFRENAILVISIPYLIVGFAFELVKEPNARFLIWRQRLFGKIAILIILVIVIGFWILRNLV